MPVQNIGNDVISAYLAGRNILFRRQAFEAQTQQRQEALAERQRQFNEQQKQASEQFKAEQGMRQAAFDLNKSQAILNAQKSITEGFIPGEQIGDVIKATIPGLGQVEGQSPEAFARSKQPTLDAQTKARIDQAIQTFEGTIPARSQLAITQSELDVSKAREIEAIKSVSAKELLALRQKGQVDLEHLRGRYRIAAAAEGKKAGAEDFDTSLAVNDAMNGAFTTKNFNDFKLPTSVRTKIFNEVQAKGGRILSEAQTNEIKSLAQVANIITLFERGKKAIDAKQFVEANELLDQGTAVIDALGRAIGGQKGVITERDTKRMMNLRPSFPGAFKGAITGKDLNQSRLDQLLSIYRDRAKAIMSGLGPRQMKMIEETFNLLPLIVKE